MTKGGQQYKTEHGACPASPDALGTLSQAESHPGAMQPSGAPPPQGDRQLNVLSLFSGCGGMDLGFEGGFTVPRECLPADSSAIEALVDKQLAYLSPTRFRIVFANDIMREAQVAWTHHFARYGYSPDTYRLASIVDLVREHHSGKSIFPVHVDVVTGGFPCQDFSLAGKRRGFQSQRDHRGMRVIGDVAAEETRGKLYYWMKQVIDIVKPNVFIAENVKGLVNLADAKDIIQHDFSSADGDAYIVLPPQILHAADYGVPQSRERVIFIGLRKAALSPAVRDALADGDIPPHLSPYPPATHAYTQTGEHLLPPVPIGHLFEGLAEPEVTTDPSQRSYSRAKFMGSHCQGQKEINPASIAPTIRSEHHGNIEYRRLSAEHGGALTHELAQGLPERRLTPRECALIQTFPSDYEFVIPNPQRKGSYLLSPSAAYKIIGNAVPPLLAYHIARRIEQLWNVYFPADNGTVKR